MGCSCGNRHCPNCQHEKTQAWLQKQSDRLLPIHHFLVTFTVPEELRGLLRACPNEGYEAIFATGSATILKLLTKPKWLGSDKVGFFGVLQTWGRDRTPHADGIGESVNNLAEAYCKEMNRPMRTRTPGGVGGASK